jgi:hypothetical protein
MNSKILILLFLSSYVYSDYLLSLNLNIDGSKSVYVRCIKEFSFSDNSIYYLKSSNDKWYLKNYSNIENYSIKAGYFFNIDDNVCERYFKSLSNVTLDDSLLLSSSNLSLLGLSDYDLNLSFAFSGIFLSSLFLFGIFSF